MEKIREFLWPILEKGEMQKIKHFTDQDINIENENLDRVLDYSIKIYESELSRNTAIESKASLFIGTLAIITSVVLAITTTLISQNTFSSILLLLVCLLFFLTIYVLRTVWFAIRVHERKSFHTFFYSDINIKGNKNEFSKKLIISIINKTKKNSIVINSKIDNMVMAQEYYKRAIITLSVYSVFLLIFFINKFMPWFDLSLGNILNYINGINVVSSLLFSSFTISFFSIFLNFILFFRLKKINQKMSNNNFQKD